jgi:hypothetical protein
MGVSLIVNLAIVGLVTWVGLYMWLMLQFIRG